MLSEIIRTGDSPVEVGRRAGSTRRRRTERHDRSGGGPGGSDGAARFRADRDAARRHVDIVLGACPFETTALVDPDTVCGVHLGLAYGAADALGGLVIDELIPRDPRRGTCRLRCHLES